ncbi:MAG: glycosyltransferase family 39 protein [Candidatus Omnitrophica bacterium]|nr:glycosyltransferase family 39 protein [Candidatus Omnitrophota bacterium]
MVDERIQIKTLCWLTVLAGIIRLSFIFRPIGYDEALSFLVFGSKPLKEALTNYVIPNNHLFHTFLVHMVTAVLPPYPWIIRLPAFIAGVVMVPCSYFVFELLYSSRIALLVSSMIAASSILVEYSVNARGYTLMIVFFLLSLGAMLKVMTEDRFKWWFLFVISSILGFYTMPVMIYPFGFTLLLIPLVFKTRINKKFVNKFLLAILIIGLGVFILYLPVICKTGINRLVEISTFKPIPLSEIAQRMNVLFLKIYAVWNRDLFSPLEIIFIVSFFISLFKGRFRDKNRAILLSAIVATVGLILLTRLVPFPRCFLFLLPIYFGMISSGLHEIISFRRKGVMYFLSGLLILFMYLGIGMKKGIYHSDVEGRLKDPERIIYVLKRILRPGDKVLAYYPVDAIVSYYFFLHRLSYTYLDVNFQQAKRIFAVLQSGQDLDYLLGKFTISKTAGDFREILNLGEVQIYLAYLE